LLLTPIIYSKLIEIKNILLFIHGQFPVCVRKPQIILKIDVQ
jgi:hypothetical protein